MEQDAPKIETTETSNTAIVAETVPVQQPEVADGPDAAAVAKKRKNKNKKKKKAALLLLDLAASDFVPTPQFKFDPVSEPIITATAAAKATEESKESKEGAVAEKKPKKKKVKIAEPAVLVEEKKGESAAKEPVTEEKEKKKKSKKKSKKDHNATFNIDAPSFTPTFTPVTAKPANDKPEPVQLPKAPEPVADFGGYQNRHLTNPV